MGRLLSLGLAGLLLAVPVRAERVTLVVTGLPEGTPADAVLTIGANVNGWDPAARGFAFGLQGDGTHRLEIEVAAGSILEYKVTRGSWATVETAADGGVRESRRLEVVCATTVDMRVAGWADTRAPEPRERRRPRDREGPPR